MGLAVVFTRALSGVDAIPVDVEVHVTGGLPAMSIVGLPETVVRESKDRVRGAIENSRFVFPQRRITVNLAPADLPMPSMAAGPMAMEDMEEHQQKVEEIMKEYKCPKCLEPAYNLMIPGGPPR